MMTIVVTVFTEAVRSLDLGALELGSTVAGAGSSLSVIRLNSSSVSPSTALGGGGGGVTGISSGRPRCLWSRTNSSTESFSTPSA